MAIEAIELPETSLLARYRHDGAYTDCYVTEISRAVSLRDYIEAFYTTPLFKLERTILKWAVARPSSDADARALAEGRAVQFAAWKVEAREDDQIVLSDYRGRTRSWLMSLDVSSANETRTRLHFGSAVVPGRRAGPGYKNMGGVFGALLPFHRHYSRALLQCARQRLSRQGAPRSR